MKISAPFRIASASALFVILLVLSTGCGGMNGTLIEPPQGEQGMGILKIYNGFSDDIVVKLYNVNDPTTAVRFVYISAKNDVELEAIPVGNYMVRYSMGKEWDNASKMFSKDRANFETDQTFTFEEKESEIKTSDGIRKEKHYSIQTFILNSGGGDGNVSTTQIDDDEFMDK